MEIYEFVGPNESNGHRLFNNELENNPLIFFHVTPKINVESIIKNGFRSAQNLKPDSDAKNTRFISDQPLESVSYAQNSSTCLYHRGSDIVEDYAVFVVEFRTLNEESIIVKNIEIHVYGNDTQPTIKGYCVIPQEYVWK